jgi:hypothetical protein
MEVVPKKILTIRYIGRIHTQSVKVGKSHQSCFLIIKIINQTFAPGTKGR